MSNKDLVWDLDAFNKRQFAQSFVIGFENKLCVFSASVKQLYTNYNIFFPEDEDRKLVILPNPYAHHDTFYGITENAVKATGLFITPASADTESLASTSTNGKPQKLNMLIPLKTESRKYRPVPLSVGLNLINKNRPRSRPFLPVLMKGDLREMDANTPCLHLHSLILDDLPDLSSLEIKDIQTIIQKRLLELSQTS